MANTASSAAQPTSTRQMVSRPGIDITVHLPGVGHSASSTPPVLLIHGGLHDPMAAERFWFLPGIAGGLAAGGHRVIAPDRRYSLGGTHADLAVHTWDTEVDDMLAVLDALGVDRAHVIAGSNGCSVALRLAARAPQRCASLVLGWPAAPDAEPLQSAFIRTADAVAAAPHTTDWLALLQRDGVRRPDEARPGFAFGHALLHDDRLAAAFTAHSSADAADLIRASAAALLPGDPLRGVTAADCTSVAASGIPLAILPSLPDDPWHPPRTVAALRAIFPAAVLLPEAAPPPAPTFAQYRETCTAMMSTWITNTMS